MIKFNSPVTITVRRARTVQVKPRTLKVAAIDFTHAKWIIDATAKTVTVLYPGWPRLVVMGGSAKTAYVEGCTEAQREAATLAEVEPTAATPASQAS